MIEVPSCVLCSSSCSREVDFVSVGTNDLVQYLLAADRDKPWVSQLYDPYAPGRVWAPAQCARARSAAGKPSSVCGEMAGDYATALLLHRAGLQRGERGPNFLHEVKYAVRQATRGRSASHGAGRVPLAETKEEVRAVLGAGARSLARSASSTHNLQEAARVERECDFQEDGRLKLSRVAAITANSGIPKCAC
jgi:phosphoenolpyruvate-protein kinase (PTS system EI component)